MVFCRILVVNLVVVLVNEFIHYFEGGQRHLTATITGWKEALRLSSGYHITTPPQSGGGGSTFSAAAMVAAATATATATASVVAMQDRQDIPTQFNQVNNRHEIITCKSYKYFLILN